MEVYAMFMNTKSHDHEVKFSQIMYNFNDILVKMLEFWVFFFNKKRELTRCFLNLNGRAKH